MRMLFHGPGVAVHRPAARYPGLTGVQPVVVDTLAGLRESQKLTSNRGNIIHAEAPARLFQKDAAGSAYGNIVGLSRFLGSGFADKIAESFDLIVFSMANFIRPGVDMTPFVNALQLLKGRVPFIVLGAGLQGQSRLDELSPSVKKTLAIYNKHALVFGVRGKQTQTWLHQNGFPRAEALGCPSLYSFPQSVMSVDGTAVRAKGNGANVMTAGYLTVKGGHNFERGFKLAKALEGVASSYVFQDEFLQYGDLANEPRSFNEGSNTADASLLNAALSQETGAKVQFDRYYYFTESSAWRQACLSHDVYVGDRFHGGVAALQAGLPTVFLAQDNRVSEMTEFYSLPRLTIDEFSKMGLKRTLDKLLASEALDKMKTTYRTRHAAFCESMARHGIKVVTQP